MYVVAGVRPASARAVVSAPTVSRTAHSPSSPSFRSTSNPVSLSEASVQVRSTVLEPVAWAARPDGASGGTSSVVPEASPLQSEHPISLQARTR